MLHDLPLWVPYAALGAMLVVGLATGVLWWAITRPAAFHDVDPKMFDGPRPKI